MSHFENGFCSMQLDWDYGSTNFWEIRQWYNFLTDTSFYAKRQKRLKKVLGETETLQAEQKTANVCLPNAICLVYKERKKLILLFLTKLLPGMPIFEQLSVSFN